MSFAVFITTHERVESMTTYDTLRKCGYTGKIYIVVDNEDTQLQRYLNRYDDVLVYNKQLQFDKCDKVIDTTQKASVTYPRNAVEEYAKHFKLDTFMVCDDDIVGFRYRWVEGNTVKSLAMNGGLDRVFELYSDYILAHDIAVTSFVHMLFYMSGVHNLNKRISEQREIIQLFIRNTKFDLDWKGVMRQDMLTNTLTSKVGYIWWALPFITYDARPMNETGENNGGMKETYDNINEYQRSFLGVITTPSCLKIGGANGRIKMQWDKSKAYPMIISGRYRK